MKRLFMAGILLSVVLSGCDSHNTSDNTSDTIGNTIESTIDTSYASEQEDDLSTDVTTVDSIKEENETMEYEFDGMMDFGNLDLYYEAHVAGMDGECFIYSVYFENGLTDEKLEETENAISEFIKPYNEKEIYLGYIDVSKADDKLIIYLDLGNVNPNDTNTAINGIQTALNNVSGIKSVIINEDYGYDF